MSALSYQTLRRLGPDLVNPFDETLVQPASIDLRLHDELVLFDQETEAVRLGNIREAGRRIRFINYALEPGEFCLGGTAELVDIPDDLVARIEGKSSIGRLGLTVHVTAGFIDPGFRGRITLEICNLRRVPIVLRPGLAICQLGLISLDEPTARPYDGRYQGDCSVSPSRLGSLDAPESYTGLRYPAEWS